MACRGLTKLMEGGAMRNSKLVALLWMASVLAVPSEGAGQVISITEIIDSTGDGAGNSLSQGGQIAIGGSGNVYVTGPNSDNAFQIRPDGVITKDHRLERRLGGKRPVRPRRRRG